nr:uncharacterized protein LOC112782603 isoform X3 [Arachis hypogaea]
MRLRDVYDPVRSKYLVWARNAFADLELVQKWPETDPEKMSIERIIQPDLCQSSNHSTWPSKSSNHPPATVTGLTVFFLGTGAALLLLDCFSEPAVLLPRCTASLRRTARRRTLVTTPPTAAAKCEGHCSAPAPLLLGASPPLLPLFLSFRRCSSSSPRRRCSFGEEGHKPLLSRSSSSWRWFWAAWENEVRDRKSQRW